MELSRDSLLSGKPDISQDLLTTAQIPLQVVTTQSLVGKLASRGSNNALEHEPAKLLLLCVLCNRRLKRYTS